MVCVLIVDGTRVHCEALAHLLKQVPGVSIVDAISESAAAVSCLRELHPDMVLLNIAMPGGTAVLRAIITAMPTARIIVLGISEDEDDVIRCAEAGVRGFLPRNGSFEDLVNMMDSVVRGEFPCSARVAATLLRRVSTLASGHLQCRSQTRLTPREREILQLIDKGLSNKEISRKLSVEVHTVKAHVHNILEKLQVNRRGEAAAMMRGTSDEAGKFHLPPSISAT